MKNTFGNFVTVTLFGESHGPYIGAVLDGVTPGIPVNADAISLALALRRPQGDISTPRQEKDKFEIVSGVYEGHTTGAPICILIPNEDVKSGDYAAFAEVPRPSHADYTAYVKYQGANDPRGGGHFSGRLTAALVAVGAICREMLAEKGIAIGTHIAACHGVKDRDFADLTLDIAALATSAFPVLDADKAEAMREEILAARAKGDSVGGILETVVVGLPVGVGEPWFDSLESVLSHALFSIPAVKGVEFGDGFALAELYGSEANDPFRMVEGKVVTTTNHNGGINGGISNGMPVVYRVAVKPTPTIGKEQDSVDLSTGENTTVAGTGRHDPAIIHRATVVVDAMSAIVLVDMLSQQFGKEYFKNK